MLILIGGLILVVCVIVGYLIGRGIRHVVMSHRAK